MAKFPGGVLYFLLRHDTQVIVAFFRIVAFFNVIVILVVKKKRNFVKNSIFRGSTSKNLAILCATSPPSPILPKFTKII